MRERLLVLGLAAGALALFYALFDALPLGVVAFPLVVVGTNSLLIYLMGQTLKGWTSASVACSSGWSSSASSSA